MRASVHLKGLIQLGISWEISGPDPFILQSTLPVEN
jgi:hypothetical protein